MELPERIQLELTLMDIAKNVALKDVRVKCWVSHHISGISQAPPGASGDDFSEMSSLSAASHCLLTPGTRGNTSVAVIEIAQQMRTIPPEVYERAAIWIALYVRSASALDHDLPPTFRNVGMGVLFLRHANIPIGSVHEIALFNGTPLKAGFALDKTTFHKTAREQYLRTATLLVTVRGSGTIDPSQRTRAVLYPPSVLRDAEEVALNRYLFEVVQQYARHGGEQKWHTFMHIAVPGNSANLGVVAHMEYRTVPSSSYAAWTRHVLWREGLTDAEFGALAAVAMGPASPDRKWAIHRMRWIVGLVCEPFGSIPYRSDSIGDRSGEYMGTNILTEKAGDCDNFAIATYLFVKALKAAETHVYAPVATIQRFLASYRNVLAVMHTKAASHAATAGGPSREKPCLHMTVVLIPEHIITPGRTPEGWEIDAEIIMLEGTGTTSNMYCHWDLVYGGGQGMPFPVAESCRRYRALSLKFFRDKRSWSMQTPAMPAPSNGVRDPYAPARRDPFYSRFMNLVYEGEGAAPDHYKDCVQVAFGADATRADKELPGVQFAEFASGRWDRVTLKDSPHARVFRADAARQISAHIEPSPTVIIGRGAGGVTGLPAVKATRRPAIARTFSGMPLKGARSEIPTAGVSVLALRTVWAAINVEARSDIGTVLVPYIREFVAANPSGSLYAAFDWDVFEVFPTVYVLVIKFTL